MTMRLTATEAKARLLEILDGVEHGEEVEITRHGRLIARVVPAKPAQVLEGMFAGKVHYADDLSEEELFTPVPPEDWDDTDFDDL